MNTFRYTYIYNWPTLFVHTPTYIYKCIHGVNEGMFNLHVCMVFVYT